MNTSPVDSWVQAYLRAWASDDPEDIAALFTEDARYFTEPYAEPWKGRAQIVSEWIARGDSGRDWSFTYRTVLTHGDLSVVQGHTHYGEFAGHEPEPPADYDNLWVVRLSPDGRAREFTEWWMKTGAPPTTASDTEERAAE